VAYPPQSTPWDVPREGRGIEGRERETVEMKRSWRRMRKGKGRARGGEEEDGIGMGEHV